MQQSSSCPRCRAPRLAVIYYDVEGKPIGGQVHCADCGSRHSARLTPAKDADETRAELRKAS